MAKKLKAITATDKLSALVKDLSKKADAWSAFLSAEAKNEILSLRYRFFSLASKLPKNLMIHEDVAGAFTIGFLVRLNDEQLEELKEAVALQKDEDVFLYFRREEKGEASVELKDFEGFDFSKVIKINFNGKTAPLLRTDSDCVHYVSVTLVVA